MGNEDPGDGVRVDDPRLGRQLLVSWGTNHLAWSLIDVSDAMNLRNPGELRELMGGPGRLLGRLVCAKGNLRSADSSRSVLQLVTSDEDGSALPPSDDEIRIETVHQDLSVPSGSTLRACGIFVGSFRDPRKGTSGAILVGMLDTPSNRQWVPPHPATSEMDRAPNLEPGPSPNAPL